MWDRKELKRRGKAAFKANYWKSVIAALLLVIFAAGSAAYSARSAGGQIGSGDTVTETQVSVNGQEIDVTTENGQLTVNGQTYDNVQDAVSAIGDATGSDPESIRQINDLIGAVQADPEGAKSALTLLGAAILGIGLVITVVGAVLRVFVFNPIEIGCRSFFLRNSESPAELSEIKTGFNPYGRNVVALLLRGIYLFLWSLLCIIPGLIKSYSYRMVPYILADDPTISGKDAITLSRQMMDGNKWKAFVLDLSFLGWHLLSAVTLGLVGIFYVFPYMSATDAELYRELKAQQ